MVGRIKKDKQCWVQRIQCSLMASLVMGISACAGTGGGVSPIPEDSIRKQEQTPVKPHAANVIFSWLQFPEDVDVRLFSAQKLSQNGQILIGTAPMLVSDAATRQEAPKVFYWDLARHKWLWLNNLEYENGVALMGMDGAGNHVFGAQWVWQKSTGQMTPLPSDFWAYVLRDEGNFLGAGLNSTIEMLSVDGSKKEIWSVEDVLNLDSRGNIKDNIWVADRGVLVSSTMEQCLLDEACDQAYFTRWTPEQGKSTLSAQMPERPPIFFQSDAGPQQVSPNGQWLAGAVGQNLYLWDDQGQMKFLGGFDNGGAVVALSDDGKIVVGYTIGNQTKQKRSWIWTETEGLNWLDEWLRNHGVAAEDVSPNMQVKLLSPDRRVIIGVTQPEEGADPQTPPRWWKVDLSEHLRVLV